MKSTMIKKIDFLAPQFSFTIFKSEKYQTYLGAICSIILLILAIIFTFVFGSDFFYKTNPIVNFENKIGKGYFFENLTLDRFFIPWQLTYLNNTPVNYTGILYPHIRYVRGRLVNKVYEKKLDIELNYTNCDKKYNTILKDAENYNCLNFNPEYDIGGYFDNDDVHFFTIQFFYCPSRDLASVDGNCTPLETLRSFLGQQITFSIYYPMIHYESTLDDPLSVEWLNYYYILSPNLLKTDRFYFMKSVAQDDVGFIMKEKKTSFKYYVNKIQGDYTFLDINYYYSNTTVAGIYNSLFFLSKNYDVYNRTYMKFQNLTALVGSFISVIRLICSIIYYFINILLRDLEMVNDFFELQNYNKGTSQKKLIHISEFREKQMKNSENNIENDFNSNIPKSKNSVRLKIKNTPSPILSSKLKEIQIDAEERKTKIEFSSVLKQKFLYLFCKSHDSSKLEIYERAKDFLNQRLDFMNYLKMWERIQKIQYILLNNNQIQGIKLSRKISLTENFDSIFMEEDNDNEEELIDYFKMQLKKKKINEIDKKVISLLDNNLKKIINEK